MTRELFDRERLAGYDREILDHACVTLVGCGAGSNNVAQCLALAGVRELRCIDFDFVEVSNLTRAPLFARSRNRVASKRSNKAKELALAALDLSYAEAPVVRYAPHRIEALGLGAFKGSDVVIAGVDNAGVRATLAKATGLLGIPMVEGGFSGLRGNVSAYANIDPDEPCYCCLNPNATPARVSCETYAARVVAEGRVPATQTMAALTGALVAEAVIRLLHGDRQLSGHVLSLDATTWRTSRMKVARDPECRWAHRRIESIAPVPVGADDPVERLFEALPDLKEPELMLPDGYIDTMPCERCGNRVRIRKPEWAFAPPPQCAACPETPPAKREMIETHASVAPGSALARQSLRRLGLPPCSIVEVCDRATQASLWVELAGSVYDLFVTRQRGERPAACNVAADASMDPSETHDECRLLDQHTEQTP